MELKTTVCRGKLSDQRRSGRAVDRLERLRTEGEGRDSNVLILLSQSRGAVGSQLEFGLAVRFCQCTVCRGKLVSLIGSRPFNPGLRFEKYGLPRQTLHSRALSETQPLSMKLRQGTGSGRFADRLY